MNLPDTCMKLLDTGGNRLPHRVAGEPVRTYLPTVTPVWKEPVMGALISAATPV